jgi:hypothetical protein
VFRVVSGVSYRYALDYCDIGCKQTPRCKGGVMKNDGFDRRAFLKSAVAGSAAAVTVTLPHAAQAQKAAPTPDNTSAAYAYLNFRRGRFCRGARRPHGAGRRVHAEGN